MAGGRPPMEFNGEFADILCGVISQSEKSLSTVLKVLAKEDSTVPSLTTIMGWLRTNQEFAQQYARAKEEQADYLAEQMLEIADDSSLDVAFTEEGKPYVDREHINRSRLRVDTRKWIASKLKPKKYGDKIEQTLQNPDGSAISLAVNFIQPKGVQ